MQVAASRLHLVEEASEQGDHASSSIIRISQTVTP